MHIHVEYLVDFLVDPVSQPSNHLSFLAPGFRSRFSIFVPVSARLYSLATDWGTPTFLANSGSWAAAAINFAWALLLLGMSAFHGFSARVALPAQCPGSSLLRIPERLGRWRAIFARLTHALTRSSLDPLTLGVNVGIESGLHFFGGFLPFPYNMFNLRSTHVQQW